MKTAPWSAAWDQAGRDPSFIDLIDSRFHQNGLLPDPDLFSRVFQRWLAQRLYQPDSRGDPRARQALRSFYGQQGWEIPEDQFFLTSGTSEAYVLLFSTLAKAGETVALPRPGYPLFEHLARHSRLKPVYYNQPWSRGWQPDADSLEAALTPSTRFVILISPNNPTGQVITPEALAPMVDIIRKHNLILIVDEVFDACWEGPTPLPRPGALYPEVRTFTLNGISKRFGSPDLKLAWIAVSGPRTWVKEVSQRLDLANDSFLSANSYSQFLLPDLFTAMNPWQERLRGLLAENRRQVEDFMRSRPSVQGLPPRGGIHGLWCFDRLPPRFDDEGWAIDLLHTQRLGFHPGYFYDVQEPGVWLVYSLLKEPSVFGEGLRRLSARLSAL